MNKKPFFDGYRPNFYFKREKDHKLYTDVEDELRGKIVERAFIKDDFSSVNEVVLKEILEENNN